MIDLCEPNMLICGSRNITSTDKVFLTIKHDLLSIKYDNCKITSILSQLDHYHKQCIKTALYTKHTTLLPDITDKSILSDMKNAVIGLYLLDDVPINITISITSVFVYIKHKYYLDHRIKNPNVNLEYQLYETM